jgi:hypothetical protein
VSDKQLVVMVLPQGQDIIGEVVKEEGDRFVVRDPRFIGFDPESKGIRYLDFLPHCDPSAKAAGVPVLKAGLLTWYKPRAELARNFEEARVRRSLKERGIEVPGGPVPGSIIVP